MSDKKQANNNTPEGLLKPPTSSEAMFFFAIVKNTKSKSDIDWNGVAEDVNLKNADVAKVRFGQIKRKLGISEGSPAKKPKTGGDDSTAGPSPLKARVTKKPATPRKRFPVVKKEEKNNDEKEEEYDKAKVKKEASSSDTEPVVAGDFVFEDDFDPGHQLQMEMGSMN